MMTSNVKSVTKVEINVIKFPLTLRLPQNFITGTQVVADRFWVAVISPEDLKYFENDSLPESYLVTNRGPCSTEFQFVREMG
jgi:hypothetical protein